MNRVKIAPVKMAPVVKHLGVVNYLSAFDAMKDFTRNRTQSTPDEFWVLEHPSVYTLGRASKEEYLLNTADIPVIPIDRGGQVTYHGPGQITVYTLIDLKRLGIGVRALVSCLENAIIETLASLDIVAKSRREAPGVYVNNAKLAALGLRVSRGCSYHGLSLNYDMNMTPWNGINPCGLGVTVTQIRDLVEEKNLPSKTRMRDLLCDALYKNLNYEC